MMKLVLIGSGGCLGALSRYLLSGAVQGRYGGVFPVGTLAVNVLGCFLFGALMALMEDHPLLSPESRALLATGFLGSLTTFSTFGFETSELLHGRDLLMAGGNIVANVALGLLALEAGILLTRLIRL
jgi:fluoride exporter